MSMAIKYAMNKKAKKMAGGGGVHQPHKAAVGGKEGQSEAGDHVRWEQAQRHSGNSSMAAAHNTMAKRQHQKVLSELESEKGKDRTNLAEGGNVECGTMVDRIMRKRMAHGGEVMADFEPNEFDELELEPAPSPPHSGADYGDDLGDEEVAEEDHDLVSRIMRSRSKKDRMPRPA